MLEYFDIVLSFAVVMLLLSLLVTTLVQIVVAVGWQRYYCLKRGIERLIRQIAPDLGEHASEIAERVLCHPAVAAGRSCTTAIRKEELIRLLDDLATNSESSLKGEAKKALAKVMEVPTDQEVALAVDHLKGELIKVFRKEVARVAEIFDRTLVARRQVVHRVGAWFDTVMDRTTDQFLLRTRLITAATAVVLAFAFHIDSLSILDQLQFNPGIRAQLVQGVDATLQRAEDVLALSAVWPAMASAAIQAACTDLGDKPDDRMLDNIPRDLITRRDGIIWIDATFKDPSVCNPLQAAYEKRFTEKTKSWLQDLRLSTDKIKEDLDRSTLVILPRPFPRGRGFFTVYWGRHFWGTLMTSIFLSLGAPFWYNVLRQLSSLRPAIAQKVEPKSETET